MKLKRLGIVGCGNVGAGLIMQLAEHKPAQTIEVTSRNLANAEAAILDAGSAYPKTATELQKVNKLQGTFDVTVVTAGEMPHGQISQDELLQKNLDIAVASLEESESHIIVVIGTPVDRLTEKLAKMPKFRDSQIIGFGGQLDLARTHYALAKHNVSIEGDVFIIGEHGPRTLPVYNKEEAYDVIQTDVATTVQRIASTGSARNLATGIQLRKLLQALAGEEQVLCVSMPDPEYDGLGITWPYIIKQNGILQKVNLPNIGSRANDYFQQLLETKRQEAINFK